jgi:hypothetical protein
MKQGKNNLKIEREQFQDEKMFVALILMKHELV